MLVKDAMTADVACCLPSENLAEVAARMWNRRCGGLPIVDGHGGVIGIITDRDVCIALGTRNLRASDVKVEEVKLPSVFTCAPDDDAMRALEIMAGQNVRRLPVVEDGFLVGLLSIDDLIRHAAPVPAPDEIPEAAALYALRQIRRARQYDHGAVLASVA